MTDREIEFLIFLTPSSSPFPSEITKRLQVMCSVASFLKVNNFLRKGRELKQTGKCTAAINTGRGKGDRFWSKKSLMKVVVMG